MASINETIEPSDDGRAKRADHAAPETSRRRLLLIEDDPATRLVLLNQLRLAGFEVDVAVNGHVALQKLSSSCPDAIVMDLLLADVKGVEVIKWARQHAKFGERPIYVCTNAVRMDAWTRRGTKAGATKVFDRAAIPLDQIVAEIKRDLAGSPANAGTGASCQSGTATLDRDKEVEAQETDSSTQEATAAGAAASVQPHAGDEAASLEQTRIQTPTVMKRLLGAFGLGKAKPAVDSTGASAEPSSIPPRQNVNAAVPEVPAGQSGNPLAGPPVTADKLPGRAEVTVLTLDQTGSVASADEAAAAMFGWNSLDLVGQNVMMLLKEGLNNEMGRFLQRLKTANRVESCPFQVVARRKDGTEFPASVTPLTWNSDTTLTRKSEGAKSLWTAVFRDATPAARTVASNSSAVQTPTGTFAAVAEAGVRSQGTLGADTGAQQVVGAPAAAVPDAAAGRDAVLTSAGLGGDLAAANRADENELHRLQAALDQAELERRQFEQRLQDLAAERANLEKRLVAESHTKEEVLKSSHEAHAQLDGAKSAAERAEAARQQEAARSSRLETELADLRLANQNLTGQLATEQQAVAEMTRRSEELESRLRENAGNLEFVKADAGKHAEQHAHLEAELRAQLETTKAATNRAEAALREEAERNKKFEERLRVLHESLKSEQLDRAKRFDGEVTRLWQAHDELQERLNAEQEVARAASRRAEAMENHLRERSAEVERVKTELEEQTAEQERLEAEWREKLAARDILTSKLEAALSEAEEINKRSEQELVGLRKEREELSSKLAIEHQVAMESRQRVEDLERRLRENGIELQRVNAALRKSGSGKGFETELSGLHQMRDMLSLKLTAEQRANEDSRKRSDELESRLRENSAELERVKADADAHAKEQARLESELQEKVNVAMTAAGLAEAALKEKATRCSEFEQELLGLRHTRDELHERLEAEQQEVAASKQRNGALEGQLRQNANELEKVKAAADKNAAEHERLEADLRAQLESARAAAVQAESALQAEASRNREFEERMRSFDKEVRLEQNEITKRFEKELADSLEVRRELEEKLSGEQRLVAESTKRNGELEAQVRSATAELERIKEDLNQKIAERRLSEAELREQLKAAKTAGSKAEMSCKEEAQRSSRLEKELVGIRQVRDELKNRLGAEQQAAQKSKRRIKELEKKVTESAGSLERMQTELKKQATEGRPSGADAGELPAAAKAAVAQAEAALKEKSGQLSRLEHELAAFRTESQTFHAKLVEEQQATAKARRRSKELEKQLRDSATAFARFKTELEKRLPEPGQQESDLLAAKAAAQKAEAAHQEASARSAQLAEDLDGLRQMHDELSARFKGEQQASAAANRRIEDLENRLREGAAELGRARAALENQATPRPGSEHGSPIGANNLESLTEEVCRLRENEAARVAELSEVERRVRESVAALARVTADLEKERGERRRVEQRSASLAAQLQQLHGDLKQQLELEKGSQERVGDLEEQLREREDRLARVSADWQKELAERQAAEEQLRSFGDMSAQLRKYLSLFEESKKVFKRTQDELEARLQTSLKALSESESKLQKETSDRQRLEETLATAQRGVHEQSERNALELSKLQSDLQMEQFERKRLEGDALQSRYASLDSARVGRAMVSSFRRQVREPVDHLIQSTRRLLEVESEAERKKLVESVLEDALLLQTNLQEAAASSGGSATDKEGGSLQP